jgi:hypothetical protein
MPIGFKNFTLKRLYASLRALTTPTALKLLRLELFNKPLGSKIVISKALAPNSLSLPFFLI